MSSEHTFEDKGKVKPKPTQETVEPGKDDGSLTAADLDGKLDPSTLTQMQQTLGNAAVQRFLAQRQAGGPAEIQEETANSINAKRGSGGSLDAGMAKKAGEAMGHDFSGVNVHTDSQADELSRDLGAKAFTTGSDIFFQSGAYDPGSSEGQQLIAHELTHVVQQGASAPAGGGKMTVNDPDDQYEEEADSVADQIMNQPDPALQRQAEDGMEEEEAPLQSKVDPALQRLEEEEAMPKLDPALQRAGEEEELPEEPVAMKDDPALQRQDIPEDEPTVAARLDPALQRQELPEDDQDVAAKLDPTLQRAMPDEELTMKADPALQREAMGEEEEMPLQEKADPALQRQEQNEEDIPA